MEAVEAIEIVARWDAQGQVTPIQFKWKDSVYAVESIGRRWQDETGLHVLVKPPDPAQVCELIFRPGQMKWYLVSHSRGTAVV